MATILAKLMNMVASPELKAKDGAKAAGAYEESVMKGAKMPPMTPGGVRSKVMGKKVSHKGEQIRTVSPITGTSG